jgi:hypothetical protein
MYSSVCFITFGSPSSLSILIFPAPASRLSFLLCSFGTLGRNAALFPFHIHTRSTVCFLCQSDGGSDLGNSYKDTATGNFDLCRQVLELTG